MEYYWAGIDIGYKLNSALRYHNHVPSLCFHALLPTNHSQLFLIRPGFCYPTLCKNEAIQHSQLIASFNAEDIVGQP